MALRVFEAPTQSQAMAAMAAELGPDALIVNGHSANGQFRLTASTTLDEPDLAQLLAPPPAPLSDGALEWMVDFHRLTDEAKRRFFETAAAVDLSGPDLIEASLNELIRFDPLPWIANQRPMALVGMPGAGKTACCARLALAARLQGQTPLVVSLDRQKTGGTAQLEGLLDAMDLKLAEPSAKCTPGQPVIIDTAGVNPFSSKDMAALAHQLDVLGVDPVLIFDANMDAADANDLAQQFEAIGVTRAIVTKLDLSRRLGGVLSLALGEIRLCGTTISPMIAKPVLPLFAIGLQRLLLRHRP